MKNIIYYSVLSFLVSLTTHPVNAADTMTSESNIFLNGNLQSQLQTQLKRNDYNNFYFNLVNFSSSYTLKNGSKFYEARRDDLDSASAIVIDPIGYFYMAYKMPDSDSITYVTNDGYCNKEVHDAIKVFANIFQNTPRIVFSDPIEIRKESHDCNQIYGKNIWWCIKKYAEGIKEGDSRSKMIYLRL